MIREARSKNAKAKAIKIRQVKQRAAAGTIEDAFVLSDSCSDDNREIIDLDDDDGAVLESEIAVRKRKSRAMPVKKRTYYDESKSSAHAHFALHLCFHDVTQLRKALDNYHIAHIRNFTYLKKVHQFLKKFTDFENRSSTLKIVHEFEKKVHQL